MKMNPDYTVARKKLIDVRKRIPGDHADAGKPIAWGASKIKNGEYEHIGDLFYWFYPYEVSYMACLRDEDGEVDKENLVFEDKIRYPFGDERCDGQTIDVVKNFVMKMVEVK